MFWSVADVAPSTTPPGLTACRLSRLSRPPAHKSTLRSEFADRTTLTIAHRLATIIDYNRILLLEGGRVGEGPRG
jgi:hypothetical protein